MGTREEKEKQKVRREILGQHFFNLSLATFSVVVLGNVANLFGFGNTNWMTTLCIFAGGAGLTTAFAYIGNKILKR